MCWYAATLQRISISLELRGPNMVQHDKAPVHKARFMNFTPCVKFRLEELKWPKDFWDELEPWLYPRSLHPTSATDLITAPVTECANLHSHVLKSTGKHFRKSKGYYRSKWGINFISIFMVLELDFQEEHNGQHTFNHTVYFKFKQNVYQGSSSEVSGSLDLLSKQPRASITWAIIYNLHLAQATYIYTTEQLWVKALAQESSSGRMMIQGFKLITI